MNTADVRNMGHGQGVFWASSIPFTVLVILVTLYFVDVPPLRRWLDGKGASTDSRESSVARSVSNYDAYPTLEIPNQEVEQLVSLDGIRRPRRIPYRLSSVFPDDSPTLSGDIITQAEGTTETYQREI